VTLQTRAPELLVTLSITHSNTLLKEEFHQNAAFPFFKNISKKLPTAPSPFYIKLVN
jgi:hypothetical protein